MQKLKAKKTAPIYFSVSDIAGMLGPKWSYLRTWRWLKKAGALVVRNGHLVTTREHLIAAFPEVWQRIAEDLHVTM